MTMPSSLTQEVLSGYERLDQQISWYDLKSKRAQNYYRWSKLFEIACAGLIPVFAKAAWLVTAFLGAGIVVLEGLQQLNQWANNWITYRSTCEALRHEKYSYLGRAGVYDALEDAEALKMLVGRVESLISTEHAKWISRQEYEIKRDQGGQK